MFKQAVLAFWRAISEASRVFYQMSYGTLSPASQVPAVPLLAAAFSAASPVASVSAAAVSAAIFELQQCLGCGRICGLLSCVICGILDRCRCLSCGLVSCNLLSCSDVWAAAVFAAFSAASSAASLLMQVSQLWSCQLQSFELQRCLGCDGVCGLFSCVICGILDRCKCVSCGLVSCNLLSCSDVWAAAVSAASSAASSVASSDASVSAVALFAAIF
jgi:hypothetical protein